MARKQEILKAKAENTQYSQLAEKGNNGALSVGGKTEIEGLTRRPRYLVSDVHCQWHCVTVSVTHERAFVTRERASYRENRDSFPPPSQKLYTNYLVEAHIRREFEGLFLFGANDI